MKKSFLTASAVLSASALVLTGCSGGDDEYPTESAEMLVGYGAGGANDTVARSFAAALEEPFGQSVLVVNRPGGGGTIAATEAAAAEADGYNLFMAPVAAFTSATLMQDVSYSNEDFRSIAPIAQQGYVVVTRESSEWNSLADLENAQGTVTHSSFGEGHASHLVAGEVLHKLGVDGQAVPFDSSGEAVQSVINGDTALGVIDLATALPRIESGELKALAVTGDEPPEQLADVPTVTDAGFPEADYLVTQALVVPAETPDEVVEVLSQDTEEAVQSDSYQEFLDTSYNTVPEASGEDWMAEFVPAERARYQEAYERLGIEG
ncbi:tripartite tricarboxylate transporter substrate binding protein [Kocuria flava]|uniref:Bug family tripartite tricarboxylate transporter substrate binding protein n=1 Tax=Kocuria flava TaxID=446860 RepID=UPI001FF3F0A2|nr:tripartite tricarboxylate transporter substrate binding protein [Kocuria flava]MCJ8503976.1 tripartite tricarboxylate transporter substrate binding protein [Kocuria flava]